MFLENGSYVVVSRKISCISISTVFLRRASVTIEISIRDTSDYENPKPDV